MCLCGPLHAIDFLQHSFTRFTAGRTQRTGAKRSYDESSFSGYNETFDDVDGRVSQAEALRKKQRKVPMKSPKEYPTPPPLFQRATKKST